MRRLTKKSQNLKGDKGTDETAVMKETDRRGHEIPGYPWVAKALYKRAKSERKKRGGTSKKGKRRSRGTSRFIQGKKRQIAHRLED